MSLALEGIADVLAYVLNSAHATGSADHIKIALD
jgi:hypothetical protein